jgi:uncharacterized Zn finger protein
MEQDANPASVRPPAALPLGSASLPCENCGRETPHRILRLDRGSRPTGRIQGVARCRLCHWTHAFSSEAPAQVEVSQILSMGGVSERSRISLPTRRRLQVGSGLPGSDRTLRIQRIDTRDGRQTAQASSDEIATVWVVRDLGASVAVSIVEGRETRSARLNVPRGTRYTVGERVTVEGTRLDIVALRAKGRTWRRPGDSFVAEEVQRIYGRRTSIPPAGRRDWRSVRERPTSFASSTSRSARSRSSPGTRRTRTAPRARTALGGATVHRSSPP